MKNRFPWVFLLLFSVVGCSTKNKKMFTIRQGSEVGIDFQNSIESSDSLNALTFEYIYNGGGVGVGDFNHDGLEDVVFGGNQVSSKIYLNKGSLQFTDVTEKAGLVTDRWITGVSIVDINQDGWDDIYFCVAGKTEAQKRKNLLYLHRGMKDGSPVFEEVSAKYGLDDDSYSTMAAFFDYDKDGDLDMYLVNNWLESYNRNNIRLVRINGEAQSTDNFYRNNGDGTFTDVSREAGILIEGYGLGIVVTDINQDSWPDVYVSNDFLSSDLLWINQKDGTFKNEIGKFIKHQTHNGMGIDIADFNNDQLNDIVVVDMFPPGHKRQKLMTAGQNYDLFHQSLEHGFEPQYMRNTLQLNRGEINDTTTLFSEIGFMAGIAQTDWSWAPLFTDVDNDGFKDLFIGNGYRKDVTDLDFIFFGTKGRSPFGTPEARRKGFNEELNALPDVKLTNYVFRNTGSLVFEDMTDAWGVTLPTFSNGAAYADFDNDGDVDMITNNIDQEVILYENLSDTKKDKNNYITLQCVDQGSVFHEKIKLYSGGKIQSVERTPYRGFQSTVSKRVHFGVGKENVIDSIEISFPDNTTATYRNPLANTVVEFSKKDAKRKDVNSENPKEVIQFVRQPSIDMPKQKKLSDIKTTRTLLHDLSSYGPCIAVGDVNNDGLDDFFFGGEMNRHSGLFIQNEDGSLRKEVIVTDSLRDDGDAAFIDIEGDGDLDLYIGGASSTAYKTPSQHLLFQNDGRGNFEALSSALPDIQTSTSCVVQSDYDGDGDTDLFVGGRIKPNEYPLPAQSYVLRNDGGKFVDVTATLNKALANPGVVSSALWADINYDNKPDLVLAGEWMPVRVFKNDGDVFTEVTEQLGLSKSNGWWNCIDAADLNGDGYPEIIAGNNGTNSYFKPSMEYPVKITAKDFDRNGSMDPLVTYFNPVEKKRFVVHNRLVLIDQIPAVKKRFETFTQYATTPFDEAFSSQDLSDAYEAEVYTLASSVLVNKGGKSFEQISLPQIAQISTVNDVLIDDLNGDGHMDLTLVGNHYAQETLFGSYDASIGLVLLGNGNFNWRPLPSVATGFVSDGDARMIKALKSGNNKLIIVSNNNGPLEVFRLSGKQELKN